MSAKSSKLSLGSSCFLGLEAVEGLDLDVLDEGVKFVLSILVFVSLAGDSDADLSGDVADAVYPDESVETGVNADILGVHLLGGEALNVTDATGSSLLELDTVEHLVNVDGVVAACGLHFCLCHLI